MPEPGVREIQLTRKQVVFLFMATVVLAVAIFLLGISVGRGVRSATGEPAGGAATTEAAVDTAMPPAEMPPPTETTPADLSYHDQLQGEKTPPAAPQPSTSTPPAAAAAPAATPPTTAANAPAETSAAAPQAAAPRTATRGTSAAARPPAASSTTEKAPSRAASGGWVVQVGAYRSRQNANRQVSRLRAKGYTAFVAAGSGSLYHVRVGPFPERADADRTATRLQREEGLKPLVTR